MEAVDIVFFSIIGGIIVLGVAAYFLYPVINKKKYKEARDDLKKREELYKANRRVTK